jgi:tRNA nucleotidyltransferase (CCA-adding enzyme)
MIIDKELKSRVAAVIPERVSKIISEVNNGGGVPLLVGGAVRDLFLQRKIKDIDIEVHNLSLANLEKVLSKFGVVRKVGKSFGVLRIDGLDVDWSIPRQDASGRKPEVKLDPGMGYEKAFARRDLTINSMGINLVDYGLIDIFGGLQDLQSGILRATDESFFKEDPLRFFRVMQFVGRFEMEPDAKLNEICKEIDISNVSKERISEEFVKLFLKSKKPSLAIDWLDKVGRLKEILPELYDTKIIEQNPEWHPEGNVFEHTKQAMNFAAQQSYESDEEKILQVASAMCHDLGKVASTKVENGRIRSVGHENTGVPFAKKLMSRITDKKDLIKKVAVLTKYHMCPGNYLSNGAKDATYKKLAWKLDKEGALTMVQLHRLFCADRAGRNAEGGGPLENGGQPCVDFLDKASRLSILSGPERPILTGKDLEASGIQPGPKMGKLLEQAYELQLNEKIKDKTKLLKKVLD